jgi:hypothetical protein
MSQAGRAWFFVGDLGLWCLVLFGVVSCRLVDRSLLDRYTIHEITRNDTNKTNDQKPKPKPKA